MVAIVLFCVLTLAMGGALWLVERRLRQQQAIAAAESARVWAALNRPPPAPPPPIPPSAARWHAESDAIARAILGDGATPRQVEAARDLITIAHHRGWIAGVSELRAAFVEGSGLPPQMADYAAGLALGRLEGRQ
jgi:hypothetical protein